MAICAGTKRLPPGSLLPPLYSPEKRAPLDRHMQGHRGPDGTAVIVAPGEGQAHRQILHQQEQISKVRAFGTWYKIDRTEKSVAQHCDGIGQKKIVPPQTSKEKAPKEHLLNNRHEDNQNGQRGTGRNSVLLRQQKIVWVLHREMDQAKEKGEGRRPCEPSGETGEVFRQIVQQGVEGIPEKTPEEEDRNTQQNKIIDQAEFLGSKEKIKPQTELPLESAQEDGEHHQVEDEKHPSPIEL